MTHVVVALEARSFCPDYRLFFVLKFLSDFLDVVSDNLTRTARKHHEQIRVDYAQRIVNSRAQFFSTAKDYFLLRNRSTREDVRAVASAGSVVVVQF